MVHRQARRKFHLDDTEATDLFLAAQREGIYGRFVKNNELFDLHDLPISVAKVAVASVLAELRRADVARGLVIVTGRGNNSEDNVAVLRPAVIEFLHSAYGLDSAVDAKNDGRIEVSAESLAKWMSSSSSSPLSSQCYAIEK